jgi:hypothetical protein
MTDSNILKDLAESFKLPTAKWPNHQVVLDLWTRRDEIDKLVQLLDVAAEWEYVDDGANIPYYKLQSEKSPVFAMLVAASVPSTTPPTTGSCWMTLAQSGPSSIASIATTMSGRS